MSLGRALGHGPLGQVVVLACLPLVVHVGQDGPDEADHGGVVWEEAHDPGPAKESGWRVGIRRVRTAPASPLAALTVP